MIAMGPVSLAMMIVAAQLPAGGPRLGAPFPPGPALPPPGVQLAPGPPRPFEPRRPLGCLSNLETREMLQTRKIVAPFRAVAEAMHEGGDLVGIHLCRSADPPLVYDVMVLRRDGRLVHVIVDAAGGGPLPARREP